MKQYFPTLQIRQLAFTILSYGYITAATASTNVMCLYTPATEPKSTLIIEGYTVNLHQSADDSYLTTTNRMLDSQSLNFPGNDGNNVALTINNGLSISVIAHHGVAHSNVVNGLKGSGYTTTSAGFTPHALNFYVSGTLTISIDNLLYNCHNIAFAQGDAWNGQHNWYAFSQTSNSPYPMIADKIGFAGNATVSKVSIKAYCQSALGGPSKSIYITASSNGIIPKVADLKCDGVTNQDNWFSVQEYAPDPK
jgi:hypothetical protein